jgi:hypothetical protein
VPTDPDLNRNELIRTPMRGDYMGMECLGLPRTVFEADFLVSMPKRKTHRWSDVTLSMKNMFGVVPGYNIRPPKTRLEKTPILGGCLPGGSGVSMSSFERGVAVTVAVHCSTSTTFKHLRVILCARKTSVSYWLNVSSQRMDAMSMADS